ncbi:MAG: hypothetical protein OXB84_08670, partial [Halobacteriovoraceae bacterium]|nr:hypothetical protein [Halobacteriovoraceae bacterium]
MIKHPLTIFLLFFLPLTGNTREVFEFSVGDKIQILSDKSYRKGKDNFFEAVGNVMIANKGNEIYGEKASISLSTGEVNIMGNARYISPEFTLYGSELSYNLNDGQFDIKNARMLSSNYIILGEKISRERKDTIVALKAEYTTCRDCPQSWTIFGNEIQIKVGEYVRILHGLIKINGVAMMYFPYIILPIKKDRQTGLLYPNINIDLRRGVTLQWPWFWEITKSNDATISPSIFGKRGPGGQLQYRHMLGDRKWFEFNSIASKDSIYLPGKRDDENPSGTTVDRHFSEYEHHLSIGHRFHHHFYYNDPGDLDMIRDFGKHIGNKITGPQTGGGGFLNYQYPILDITAESYFNQNQLVKNPKEFDHGYVQILPRVSISSVPVNVVSTDYPLLSNISLGVDGDFTVFKQNHLHEGAFIRNAHRTNMRPYIDWTLGHWGPLLFKSRTWMDYQNYRFPYEKQNSFHKRTMAYETEISFEMSKIFKLAYQKKIPMEYLAIKESGKGSQKRKNRKTIGYLPPLRDKNAKDHIIVSHSSYRHSQEFKLKHYYLFNEKTRGNQQFLRQINETQGGRGLFDHLDTLRSKQHLSSNIASRTDLPISNTLEFQWNNTVIKKTPRYYDLNRDNRNLHDNFSYGKFSYFNVSQGLDFTKFDSLDTDNSFKDGLTRLHINMGVNFNRGRLFANEYYFYDSNKHITNIGASNDFNWGRLEGLFTYNAVRVPVIKFLSFNTRITPTDLLAFITSHNYDVD